MRSTLIALAVLTASAHARAGGFALSEQSAVAAGSGGAATARTDAGAAWYNPAALASERGVHVGFSVLAAFSTVNAEGEDSAGPWSSESDNVVRTPASLHVTYSSGDWAAGLAVGIPFASGVTWPSDWPGRHEITRSRITTFRAAPFFAYRFGRVSASAGLHIDAARMELGRTLDFIAEEGDVVIDMDGWGIGAHASVFFVATDKIDIGASYKSRTSIELDGGADFDAPNEFSGKTMDQKITSDLTLPDRFAVGGHYAAGPLSAYGDAELTLWSVRDVVVLDFEREETPDVVQMQSWKQGYALRAGGDYQLTKEAVIRSGVFFDASPVPSQNLAPSSPDSNRVGASLGASVDVGRDISIDAFYEYVAMLGQESDTDEALDARYSGRIQFLGLGLRWSPRAD